MSSSFSYHAGIDAGGTTFKCGVADASGKIVDTLRIPVTTPSETLPACARFFESFPKDQIKSFGIASFGPLDVDKSSENFGTILQTPKVGWAHTPLKTYFEEKLNRSVNINTDVNGALYAEMRRGAAKGATSAAYVTVGTGIGAGIYSSGHMIGFPSHPEFGHIPVRRHKDDGDHTSNCPFHDDCLEGFASAAAMRKRFGEPKNLPADHHGWDIIADYLAQGARSLTLSFRPEKIILGGGLLLAPHLLPLIHKAYDKQMGGYLGDATYPTEELIVLPELGDHAGLLGAILLGQHDQ